MSAAARTWRFVKHHSLTVYALLVCVYLMLPIAVVILFSFNSPEGRFNYVWSGFTLDNWVDWNSVIGLQDAVETSIVDRPSRDGARDGDRDDGRAGNRALPVPRSRRRPTFSSFCRCRRPRSSSVRRF